MGKLRMLFDTRCQFSQTFPILILRLPHRLTGTPHFRSIVLNSNLALS